MKKIIIPIIILILLGGGLYFYLNNYIILPKDNLTKTNNVYKYDLTNKDEIIQASKIKDKYLYYITVKTNENNEYEQYKFIKLDLINNKKIIEKNIDVNDLYGTEIIINKDNIILISKYSDNKYTFDKNLNIIDKKEEKESDNDLYGIYNNKQIYVKNNSIFIDNKVYDKINKECGSASDIIYKNNTTLLYFTNYNTNISCLYNIKDKTTIHEISNSIKSFKDGYLFYNAFEQKITTSINNDDINYYVNNKEETTNININEEGNLIITNITNEFKIYNLQTKTIINKLKLNLDFNKSFVENLIINKYAYFFINENNTTKLYLWDYKKDNKTNEKMININETEYKFQNINLVNKLNDKYGIKIYTYDESSRYFPDFYSVASTDSIKINESLTKIETILKKFNKEFFKKFKLYKQNGIKIYLTKKLGPSSTENQISNPAGYSVNYDNDYIIALDIYDDELDQNLCHEMMHSIDSNIDQMYFNNKISSNPFDTWNNLNPKGFDYQYSYVEEPVYTYTPGNGQKVYFVDYYAHTFPIEDRARIFENLCAEKTDNVLLKYKNLKKKANRIKEVITKLYPSLKDTTLFEIIE